LIVLTVAAESWPSKTMRATSSENPLQKAHLLHSSVRESIERIVPFHLRDGSRDSSLGQGRCVQRRTSVLERAKACLLKWRQSDFTIVLTYFQITNVQSGVSAIACLRQSVGPIMLPCAIDWRSPPFSARHACWLANGQSMHSKPMRTRSPLPNRLVHRLSVPITNSLPVRKSPSLRSVSGA